MTPHYVAIDTETTGLDPYNDELVMVSYWHSTNYGGVYQPKQKLDIKELCRSKQTKLFWNAKFDITFLKNAGYEVEPPWLDVMTMMRVISPAEPSYKLKKVAEKYLQEEPKEEKELKQWLRKNKIPVSQLWRGPLELLSTYALKDAQITWQLYYVFSPRLAGSALQLLKKEMWVAQAVMDMERRGMMMDPPLINKLIQQADGDKAACMEKLRRLAGDDYNPNSVPQTRAIIYNNGQQVTRKSKKTGLPSTDRLALLEIGSEFSNHLLSYRLIDKARSTYLRNFSERTDGQDVLRCSFNPAGATTGRFSSSGPNLQNIPRTGDGTLGATRNCFVARPGHQLCFIDYDQIEVRLTAHFSQSPDMLDAIRSGDDLHAVTCKKVFGITEDSPDWKEKRQISKTLNFAIIYGISAKSLRDSLLLVGVRLTREECKSIIEEYKKQYPAVDQLLVTLQKEVYQKEGITTPYGRFLPVPKSKVYVATNYLIQSTAADFLKEKLLLCWEHLKGRKSGMIATIHDELVFEIHESEQELIPQLKELMEEPDKFSVPITCSVAVGQRWGEKEELEL